MKVYLAGPMRGYPEFNFPAFTEAAARLRGAGYDVTSPHEHDLNNGFDPKGMKGEQGELGPSGFDLGKALAWDLTFVVTEADAVVLLDGWEDSHGARAEMFAAEAAGKTVMSLEEALDYAPWLAEEEPAGALHPNVTRRAAGLEAPPEDSPRVASLKRAIGYISGDRNASYGPPDQDFKRTAALWTALGFRFVAHDGAEMKVIESHHIALAMILLKSSRLAWQPGKADSWDDIGGYSGCGHECVVLAEQSTCNKEVAA